MHELDIRYVLLDMFFIISEVKGGEVGITSCKHLHAILIGRIWLLKAIVNLCKCIPEKILHSRVGFIDKTTGN
jgi:hypothetical protein